ncbi:cytochrome-c peroxidase [Zeaxanthinibacter enoshimensis]|uniref:Cytochrome c peroxidase n=1 Tax=Zeaxanthinibacter enoshimensis TaxID=392009 RepID=A0A4V3D3Z5_9FLAO|nr:cytochrome c peroxidase [Zeaxanthinibacter enoshimensis]TDQ32341.1 cytochrome c peroxidase [Zeaxanthinibacter enoshimensis]
MKFLRPILGGLLVFITISCQRDGDLQTLHPSDELAEQIRLQFGTVNALRMPNSNDYSRIPSDPNNPLTAEKIRLGQFLFHETGIALNPVQEVGRGTYSCASCHNAGAAMQSGRLQGIAEGGEGFGISGEARKISASYDETNVDVQPIRVPSVLNTAYQEVVLWNGQFGSFGPNSNTQSQWTAGTVKETNHLGFQGLEIQAIAGLGMHRMLIDEAFIRETPYQALFDEAFPDVDPTIRYTKRTGGLAIAAYVRSLLANRSPFQKWLRGIDEAMTEEQIKGGILFFGKARCYQCHSGPGLNGMGFHALGMKDLDSGAMIGSVDEATRKGRGGFTGRSGDDYTFKTPTLYNLKDVNHLGHGGSFRTIREVLNYKNLAVPENEGVPESSISTNFIPLNLSQKEIDQLEKFIAEALYDPDIERYIPLSTPLNSCFPNADPQSKIDLGCD